MAVADVLYDTEGNQVCANCNAAADLLATDKRAAGNIVKAGWGALGSGVLAFVGPFMLIGLITYFFVAGALVSGAYVFNSMMRGNERFTVHLTAAHRATAWATACIGIALAALTVFGVSSVMATRLFGI
jgi:hypothetical protein